MLLVRGRPGRNKNIHRTALLGELGPDVGPDPLFVAQQHGHRIFTMLRCTPPGPTAGPEAEIGAIRRAMRTPAYAARSSPTSKARGGADWAMDWPTARRVKGEIYRSYRDLDWRSGRDSKCPVKLMKVKPSLQFPIAFYPPPYPLNRWLSGAFNGTRGTMVDSRDRTESYSGRCQPSNGTLVGVGQSRVKICVLKPSSPRNENLCAKSAASFSSAVAKKICRRPEAARSRR